MKFRLVVECIDIDPFKRNKLRCLANSYLKALFIASYLIFEICSCLFCLETSSINDFLCSCKSTGPLGKHILTGFSGFASRGWALSIASNLQKEN